MHVLEHEATIILSFTPAPHPLLPPKKTNIEFVPQKNNGNTSVLGTKSLAQFYTGTRTVQPRHKIIQIWL